MLSRFILFRKCSVVDYVALLVQPSRPVGCRSCVFVACVLYRESNVLWCRLVYTLYWSLSIYTPTKLYSYLQQLWIAYVTTALCGALPISPTVRDFRDAASKRKTAIYFVCPSSTVAVNHSLNTALLQPFYSRGRSTVYTALPLRRPTKTTSPVSLTCHPGSISGLLPPTNLLSRRSTFPPSENGLFQFPAPTSGTVFHHTLHLHRRSQYSDCVLRHFSSTCHIRTWFSDFPPASLWTLR